MADMYAWIGATGGAWTAGAAWADVTAGTSPAGSQPGGLNPVVIAGPGGFNFEVISGGATRPCMRRRSTTTPVQCSTSRRTAA